MRRRVAELISRWVPKLPPPDRPAAYRALLSLLACGDAALQLAAISSLQVRQGVARVSAMSPLCIADSATWPKVQVI